ncbi:hypothetical protein PR048_030675 [Dryococelus australis]|uniref:Uncharacterized protein n=1 Tax=Dryococelus australis TaxID=614101 RepID=A0ABQ9G9K9_9NEOP|nr:hypothetical protein PR048_030675 [Dryococelus australis]
MFDFSMAKAVTLSNGQPIPHSVPVSGHLLTILYENCLVLGEAKKLGKNSNEESAWSRVFSHNMLGEILCRTNDKIQSVQSRWSEDMRYLLREMDMVELKATLGLCYLSGAFRSGHEDVTSLFASDGTVTDFFVQQCI